MQRPATRYRLILENNETLVIDPEVIPYIRTFAEYPNNPDDPIVFFVEDRGHALDQRLWQYILSVYKVNEEIVTLYPPPCPLSNKNTDNMLEEIETFDLFDLYAMAKALDFYDSPLLLKEVDRVIARQLTPLTISELYSKHPAMPLIDTDEVISQWHNPILSVNKQYSERLAVQDAALVAYGMNSNLVHEIHHERPLTHDLIWVGLNHSVILTRRGLYGCGQNIFNQLGLDGGADEISLEAINVPHDIISVACGANHTMINTTHGLFGLGINSDGQLGVGVRPVLRESEPRQVFGDNTHILVLQVVCGPLFTMMLTSDGLYACGSNRLGQLGVGDNISRPLPTKVQLPCDVEVLQVALDRDYAVLLTTDGLYMCGANRKVFVEEGVIPKYTSHYVPTKIAAPPKSGNLLRVCVGEMHCILLTTVGLYGTGSNVYGELGLKESDREVGWIKLGIDRREVKTIFAAALQSFVLLNDGSLLASGNNDLGQLGIGKGLGSSIFGFNKVLLQDSVISVATGPHHTLYLTHSGLHASGDNEKGQLGINDDLLREADTPVKVPIIMS